MLGSPGEYDQKKSNFRKHEMSYGFSHLVEIVLEEKRFPVFRTSICNDPDANVLIKPWEFKASNMSVLIFLSSGYQIEKAGLSREIYSLTPINKRP